MHVVGNVFRRVGIALQRLMLVKLSFTSDIRVVRSVYRGACMKALSKLLIGSGLMICSVEGTAAELLTYTGSGGTIADLSDTTYSIDVPVTGDITSVAVIISGLHHTFFSDLRVTLSHGGRDIVLLNRPATAGDPNGNFMFSDFAELTNSQVTSNLSGGNFQAVTPFHLFNDDNPAGSWNLRIQDLVRRDTGSFSGWTLELSLNNPVSLNPVISAVPEPATWAMMLGGFGFVGGAMRYRRRQAKALHATA